MQQSCLTIVRQLCFKISKEFNYMPIASAIAASNFF